MICIDTTAIIDIFKKDELIKRIIDQVNENLCSTIINYQEIMFGLDLKKEKHKSEEKFYDNFFNGIFIFDLNVLSAKEAAKILWHLNEKGESIGKLDCIIAGILISNGVNKIITRNVKHFSKIPGLKVISY